jgi:toxin-antitoxin system PIN domain toxin
VILTDVNVLVHAFRRELRDHERYATWLTRVLSEGEEFALVDTVLIGFVRIVTNPRIFQDPAPTVVAVEFVDVLRTAPRARWLQPTATAWTILDAIAREDVQVRGNLVPDAWLASLARAHGCRLATADRGFARFADLDWWDPAA